jgi:hypothetical protein
MTTIEGGWKRGSVLLLVLVALAASGACTSEFEDCQETRTCAGSGAGADGVGGTEDGSGASTGTGAGTASGAATGSAGADPQGGAAGNGDGQGAGGSGGEAEPQPCTEDAECDDGLYCNGVEQCVEKECAAGSEPCSSADPDHCASACDESNDECGHVPLDADGDGYGDASCALSDEPGDDCNDTPGEGAAIHPGADEICNENIDDDCDDLSELTDEVVLAGSAVTLVAAQGTSKRDNVSIDVNPDGGFGVVWADWRDDDTNSRVYFVSLATDGSAGSEVEIETDPEYVNQDYPDITQRSTEFRVAFSTYYDGDVSPGDRIRYVDLDLDGSAGDDEGYITSSARPQMTAAALYYLSPDMTRCVNSTCSSVDPAPGTIDSFHAAASGSEAGVAYEKSGDVYTSSAGDDGVKVYDGDDASDPTLGTWLAYRKAGTLQIGNCNFPDGIPIDSAGPAVLYWNPDRSALYVRVTNTNCAFSPSMLVDEESDTTIGSAAIALDSNETLAVVWSSKNGDGEWTIKRRIFPVTFCE